MSGSEEKKLNSLHEEDSLYKAQGGKAAYQISPTYMPTVTVISVKS